MNRPKGACSRVWSSAFGGLCPTLKSRLKAELQTKAPSPLRSAGALQMYYRANRKTGSMSTGTSFSLSNALFI